MESQLPIYKSPKMTHTLAIILLTLNIFICPNQAAVQPGKVTNGTLTLGYLLSWSHEWAVGPFIGSAIAVGINEIKRRQLLPDYDVDWILADTRCEVRAICQFFFLPYRPVDPGSIFQLNVEHLCNYHL